MDHHDASPNNASPVVLARPIRGLCVWVTLLFLGVYLLSSGTGFYSTDGETMLRTTWAIVDRGRLAVPCDPGQPSAVEGRDSRCYSRYGLGQPLAAAPLYLVGRGVAAVLSHLDYGEVQRFVMARFNQIISALAVGMVCAVGALLYRSWRAGVGLALLYGLGTLALPYARFYFNEPLVTLGLVVGLYGLVRRAQGAPTTWLVVGGVGFGWAVLTRPPVVVLLPLFLVYLWSVWPDRMPSSSRLWGLAAFAVPVVLLGWVQVVYQLWAFGSPFGGGYAGETWGTPLWTGLYGLLLSPGKGLVIFVPLVLLAPLGWATWWTEGRRREVRLSVGVAVVWLLVHAPWWTWHGGWSWGPRFLVPVLPFLILPIASLWRQGWLMRVLIVALAAAGFAVQLGGVLVDFGDYMLLVNDEDKVLFDPNYQPIWGHYRMIRDGAPPDLVFVAMTARAALAWVLGAAGLIFLAVAKIWRGWRAQEPWS